MVCKPSEKNLIHVWKFKYSLKSISLYLTSTSACGSLQLPPETRGTISTASTSFGCPDRRLDSRGVLSGREPDPSPAGDRGDQSSGHDRSRGTAGTLRRSRSFWTQHQTRAPQLLHLAQLGVTSTAFFFFLTENPPPLLISRVQRDTSEPRSGLHPLSLC